MKSDIIVVLGESLSERKTAELLNVSRGTVRYWKKKAQDPSFHSGIDTVATNAGSHGGARNKVFDDQTQETVEQRLINFIDQNPTATLKVTYSTQRCRDALSSAWTTVGTPLKTGFVDYGSANTLP